MANNMSTGLLILSNSLHDEERKLRDQESRYQSARASLVATRKRVAVLRKDISVLSAANAEPEEFEDTDDLLNDDEEDEVL